MFGASFGWGAGACLFFVPGPLWVPVWVVATVMGVPPMVRWLRMRRVEERQT